MNRKPSTENPRCKPTVLSAPTRRVPSAQHAHTQPRSGTVLQEVFARKRETEQMRSEMNSAVAHYYDKWGRITSRYENWTTPEYYEKSEQQLRKEEEERRRQTEIEGRREKLRDLIAREKDAWERELKQQHQEKMRPSSSVKKHQVDVLDRLNTALSEQERRRREIENKLYSRWRIGMTRDEMILESKNHHQAMAKLNWLDQQVEEQLERDRQKKEEDALAEKRKSEQLREQELMLEAKQLEEKEMEELKKMLELHVGELKSLDAQSRKLKDENGTLKEVKMQLEMKQKEIKGVFSGRRSETIPMHNLRRLKLIVLDHCKMIKEEIGQDVSQLEAIRVVLRGQLVSPKEEQHFQLLASKFNEELEDLQKDVENFTTVYDSEVKGLVIKQQKIWKENAETRFRLLKNLTQELIDKGDILISCNTEEIISMTRLKEGHMRSMEELNDKLRRMTQRGEDEKRGGSEETSQCSVDSARSRKSQDKAAFMSLQEKLESVHLDDKRQDRDKDVGNPRFGKKKVAWW